MRPGISRVVVEIIILVIAVALALLIFSPLSGYIFGSLGRTATVGGAAQIQILNVVNHTSTGDQWDITVKNLGPGTIPAGTWQVYIDGDRAQQDPTGPQLGKDDTVTLTVTFTTAKDPQRQHNIVVYGPGNVQAQYLYYPPS